MLDAVQTLLPSSLLSLLASLLSLYSKEKPLNVTLGIGKLANCI